MTISVSANFTTELGKRIGAKPKYKIEFYLPNQNPGGAFGMGAFGVGAFGGITTKNVTSYLIKPPNINIKTNIETRGRRGEASNLTLYLDNTTKYFTLKTEGSIIKVENLIGFSTFIVYI